MGKDELMTEEQLKWKATRESETMAKKEKLTIRNLALPFAAAWAEEEERLSPTNSVQ